MPRLWNATIEAHRAAVRDATLDATAALVAAHGLASVTMSQIAKETGIGRATLYKYFPDVEAILLAWHERHLAGHLHHLAEIKEAEKGAADQLAAVLMASASIAHERHDPELAGLPHRGDHVVRAQRHLHDFIQDLLVAGVRTGDVRGDVAPAELASYCLHALAAAGSLPSKAAVHRLVTVTLDGLRPPAQAPPAQAPPAQAPPAQAPPAQVPPAQAPRALNPPAHTVGEEPPPRRSRA